MYLFAFRDVTVENNHENNLLQKYFTEVRTVIKRKEIESICLET